MEKFIPYEKLSKKKKRELDAGKRTLWTISPATRKPENPKAYNRRKAQKRMDDSGSVLSRFRSLSGTRRLSSRAAAAPAGQAPGKLIRYMARTRCHPAVSSTV